MFVFSHCLLTQQAFRVHNEQTSHQNTDAFVSDSFTGRWPYTSLMGFQSIGLRDSFLHYYNEFQRVLGPRLEPGTLRSSV